MRMFFLLGTSLAVLSAGCDTLPSRPKTDFNGDSAYAYAAAQVAFGPRVPGSAGHTKAGDWIVAMMRARADTVVEQRWKHLTLNGDSIPLRNIFARFRPEATQRVLYITHWDTRPTADQDRVLGNRGSPIPGANDGASGVGLLIALGDALKKTPPTIGVDLLFVDGEDYGASFDPPFSDVLLGSQYFVTHLPTPDYKPMYGVLFDMIGDAHLNILQEALSTAGAPEVVRRVWDKAAELGYGKFFIAQAGQSVTDDHVPFLERGFRVIDVVDIDYGPLDASGRASPSFHHTMQDTMENISKKSLQIVGDVALALLRSQ